MTASSIVVLDASAYRRIARDAEASGVRDAARALAAADRTRGQRALASPFALWALLAEVGSVVKPASERRGPNDTELARSARARLAVVACVEHCVRERGEPGTQSFLMTEDPDTRLCRAVGVAPPPGLAAWNEYLASLAADVAADPTDATARRIGGPLAHVVERATQSAEDYADEMQDAVLASYELAEVDVEGATIGEPLMVDLLRRDPLLHAVAARRAARAHRFANGPDDPIDPSLADASRVAELFPRGIALGRDLLRRVIAGDVEVAGRAARRWLWDLHVAYGLVEERGVTASETIAESLGTVEGLSTLTAYRERIGA